MSKRESLSKLIDLMRTLDQDRSPDGIPDIKVRDITEWRKELEGVLALMGKLESMLEEGAIPSLDLLDSRIQEGQSIEVCKEGVCIIDQEGDAVISAPNLRKLLVNLIWLDC